GGVVGAQPGSARHPVPVDPVVVLHPPQQVQVGNGLLGVDVPAQFTAVLGAGLGEFLGVVQDRADVLRAAVLDVEAGRVLLRSAGNRCAPPGSAHVDAVDGEVGGQFVASVEQEAQRHFQSCAAGAAG